MGEREGTGELEANIYGAFIIAVQERYIEDKIKHNTLFLR